MQTSLNIGHDQFNLERAASFFRKKSWLFKTAEDRDDFVQECFLCGLEAGPAVDIRLAAKSATKAVFSKQWGLREQTRYEYLGVHPVVDTGTSFADAIDLAIPKNPRDAAGVRPYRMLLNGKPIFFDKYDMASLFGFKLSCLADAYWRKKPRVLWEYNGKIYRHLKEIREENGWSKGKAVKELEGRVRRVEIFWG